MSSAPLMLSVSGARGIVGESMTPAVAAAFAAAFTTFIRESRAIERPLICIGRDSRVSGESLASAVADALAARDCGVIDLGVVATPTVGVMIDERRAAGGIVITASHNPGQWNGLKALDATGAAPPPARVERIIELFKSRSFEGSPAAARDFIVRDRSANDVHIKRVLAAIDPEPIRAACIKVVLDSINGAGCAAGRALLEALGCEVVHLNGEPTGEFAHTPEPLEANLRDLAARTSAEQAVCGFAQDPDADRLAIIDEAGRYIGEEYTLVLAAKRILETRGAGPIVANLSTSRMIDDLVARHTGATVHRSAVGEANVVATMRATGAILGGEGNGGVIWPQVTWVRDSLSAMALVLGLIAERKKPLSAIVDELPHYAMVKDKFDLAGRERAEIDAAIDRVKRAFAREQINDIDGVRIDFAGVEQAWVHLRPSNTEPIVRIIAEATTKDQARELIEKIRDEARL